MSFQPPLDGIVDYHPSDRTRIVLALADFRDEWQKAVNHGSLLKVEAPVGLILADIADRLGLSTQERHVFLGGKLTNEVDAVREQHVTVKKPL